MAMKMIGTALVSSRDTSKKTTNQELIWPNIQFTSAVAEATAGMTNEDREYKEQWFAIDFQKSVQRMNGLDTTPYPRYDARRKAYYVVFSNSAFGSKPVDTYAIACGRKMYDYLLQQEEMKADARTIADALYPVQQLRTFKGKRQRRLPTEPCVASTDPKVQFSSMDEFPPL